MGLFPARTLVAVLVALAAAGCACGRCVSRPVEPPRVPHSPPPPEVSSEDDRAETWAEMRQVHFHSAPEVVLDIRRLSGPMLRADPERPPYFDDGKSFLLRLDAAEIGVTVAGLDHLMNDHVLHYPGAPMENVALSVVTPGGSLLRMDATLAKPVRMRISMVLEASARDGDVRMHPRAIRTLGFEVGGLLRSLGLHLSRLVDLSGAHGIRLDGDDLVMDPESVLPSPAVRGQVTAVRLEQNEVVLVFGGAVPARKPEHMPRPDATSYMYYRGGTLRFGRLFMIRTDLQIVDADQSDPFEFDLAQYAKQLVAGYSRNQPDGGLLVVMPDLDDVERRPVTLPVVAGSTEERGPQR